MEEQKKKDKIIAIVLLVLLIIIVIGIALIVFKRSQRYTISDITGNGIGDVIFILEDSPTSYGERNGLNDDLPKMGKDNNKSSSDERHYYEKSEFMKKFYGKEFKKATGERSNFAHTYYSCYDARYNLLFTIVDIGNEKQFYIKKGVFDINKDTDCLYTIIDK